MILRSQVVRSGLEPELFCTKNRRVANYTIGQFFNPFCGGKDIKNFNFSNYIIPNFASFFKIDVIGAFIYA